MSRITVDLVTPVGWKAECIWHSRRGRSFGIVIATSWRTFTVGAEVFGGDGKAKGVALLLGPSWIGFATHRARRAASQEKAGRT